MSRVLRYELSVTVNVPVDDDVTEAGPRDRTDMEKRVIRALRNLDGDVDAECMSLTFEDEDQAVQKLSHRAAYFITTHAHACTECGRTFYLCTERDCALAPDVCQGCEMDRQDAYLNSLEPSPLHVSKRNLNYEKH